MRTRLIAAAAAAAALSLSSCASPGYDDATSQGLRRHIVAIGEASAVDDWHGALDRLEVMADELAAARGSGKIDQQRFDTISLAMERVRLDLEVAIAAAATEAEQQRLLDERARLEEQISRLQNGDDGTGKRDDRTDRGDKKDEKQNGDDE